LCASSVPASVLGLWSSSIGQRSVLSATVLIVVLAVVYTVIFDLDRPREGFIQVSQQPLIDLQEQTGEP
jgi:hypothetical protein